MPAAIDIACVEVVESEALTISSACAGSPRRRSLPKSRSMTSATAARAESSGAAQLVERADAADQVEVLARLHPRHQLAALVGARLVEHHHRQVLDVEVDGVAEDHHLHQRHHDDHPQRQVVARQLAELLDGERDQAFHAAALPSRCSRTSVTNASSSVGSAWATAPSVASVARIASSASGRGDRAQGDAEQVGVLDAVAGGDRRQRREGIALRHDLEHPPGQRLLDLGRACRWRPACRPGSAPAARTARPRPCSAW